MHNLVSGVFKAVALSIVFALILQLTLFLVDVSSCTTRIQSAMGLMSSEVAKNNCLIGVSTSNLLSDKNTFNTLFEKAVEGSQYFIYRGTDNTNCFQELAEENIHQYGDIVEMQINFGLLPFWATTSDAGTAIDDALNQQAIMTISFKSTVPCLRYIK